MTEYSILLDKYESKCNKIDAEFAQAMEVYYQAYDEYQKQFMQGNASINDDNGNGSHV